MNVHWSKESDIQKHNLEKTSIVVFEKFTGAVFDKVKAEKCV